LRSSGADVVAIATDVAQPDGVERLAQGALNAFGAVHIVCKNAGVVSSSKAAPWEASLADWEWIMAVNFWGVVYGIRSFVTILLQQEAGHVVNTAPIAGLTAGWPEGNYSASKHAVVSLSESLHGAGSPRCAGRRVGALSRLGANPDCGR
jgi:NAD(P)-dependent dehydrogenase (short-subunit alcohol dehydrogenase family)